MLKSGCKRNQHVEKQNVQVPILTPNETDIIPKLVVLKACLSAVSIFARSFANFRRKNNMIFEARGQRPPPALPQLLRLRFRLV